MGRSWDVRNMPVDKCASYLQCPIMHACIEESSVICGVNDHNLIDFTMRGPFLVYGLELLDA